MQRLPKRLVSGSQIAATATPYYTVPANTVTTISACTLTNTTASAITVSMYLVPDLGTVGVTNCVLSGKTVAAGESYNVVSVIGQSLAAAGTLQAVAGAAASVTLIASGYETNP